MMKPITSALTHAAAIALGILIAVAVTRGSSRPSPSSTEEKHIPARRSSTTGDANLSPEQQAAIEASRQRKAELANLRSSDFRKAWDSLPDQKLSPSQLTQIQREILRHWAAVDLEAALTAATSTAWDNDSGTGGLQQLLSVFRDEFIKRPTESWDLITSGKFGLAAALAKTQWAQAVVRDNPLLVVNSFTEIPYYTRASLFPQILEEIKKDPSRIGDYYDKLSELPQNSQFLDFVRKSIEELGARGSSEEIRDKYLHATSDAQKSILVHEFGKSLADAGIETIKSQLANIPEADRGRMLRSIAIHTPAGEHTLGLAEMVLQAGEYQQIYIQLNQRLREFATEPAKQAELANWATNLPRSPDAQKIVHRSVEPYIAANPVAAREWLDTLPAGWAKDHALAEYSQQLLWKKNDSDASWWAINQIADPELKETVTRWRSSWKPTGER